MEACKKAGIKCVVVADDATDTDVAAAFAEAKLAAENDETISAKVCSKSGSTSFYCKKTCPTSGKISMEEVMYDAENKSFVNVSPKDVMADKEAKAVKAASVESKSSKKACCKSKKACTKKKEGA